MLLAQLGALFVFGWMLWYLADRVGSTLGDISVYMLWACPVVWILTALALLPLTGHIAMALGLGFGAAFFSFFFAFYFWLDNCPYEEVPGGCEPGCLC